uniref:Uncharacterized protein n=1 Tax=Callorhinchus milii TaxID=7868 RepID=A0A4W3IBY4_CALMI
MLLRVLDGLLQVSETEREDLEESEKVQHWVERLCQTRLEQISSGEKESPETPVRRFAGGLQLHTTDLDDINLDQIDQPKRMAPPPPSPLSVSPQPSRTLSPTVQPLRRLPAPPPPSARHLTPALAGSRLPPPPLPPPAPPLPTYHNAIAHSQGTIPEEHESISSYYSRPGMEPINEWEIQNYRSKAGYSVVISSNGDHSYPASPKVRRNTSHASRISSVSINPLVRDSVMVHPYVRAFLPAYCGIAFKVFFKLAFSVFDPLPDIRISKPNREFHGSCRFMEIPFCT